MQKVIYRPVCQVQREIMYFAQKLPDSPEKQAIIDRVNEALRMSKSMNERLIELQPGASKEIWGKDHSKGRVFGPREPRDRFAD
jgi:hypothetical protein